MELSLSAARGATDAIMATTSHYALLDVSADSSLETIKRAYQRALLEVHPDKNGGEDRGFARLQEAWQTLSNGAMRAQYDEELKRKKEEEKNEKEAHWRVKAEEMEWDGDRGALCMPCRCGGVYVLAEEEAEAGIAVIPCSGCSYRLQVDV